MPPKARRVPHAIAAHGDTRIDNYYWLRDDTRHHKEAVLWSSAKSFIFIHDRSKVNVLS
jgi:oligopeptidase B